MKRILELNAILNEIGRPKEPAPKLKWKKVKTFNQEEWVTPYSKRISFTYGFVGKHKGHYSSVKGSSKDMGYYIVVDGAMIGGPSYSSIPKVKAKAEELVNKNFKDLKEKP